jgi:hypothetical protein
LSGQGGWRLNRLASAAAALALLVLLCSTGASPAFAQATWESYREVARSTVWGTVANPYDATYYIAYMEGTGFIKNQTYNIGYYDGSDNLIATDSNVKATGSAGTLKSEYDLSTDPGAAAGTWHSSVYQTPTSPPSTYLGDGVADDDFEVVAAAIPEFPTVLSAIVVAAITFAIYYWMRRRRLAGVPG